MFTNLGDRKMKRVQQGFTLIELMIVVAIVGILAAIALPAYQDFVVRSKMSEGLGAIAACKTSVQDYTSSHSGTGPGSAAAAGCSTQNTQFNAGLTVTGGGVAPPAATTIEVITQNTGANPECTLQIRSVQVASFEITSWTPTAINCAPKYVPSSFR
jgi:type IV pilus assembly protein PilA